MSDSGPNNYAVGTSVSRPTVDAQSLANDCGLGSSATLHTSTHREPVTEDLHRPLAFDASAPGLNMTSDRDASMQSLGSSAQAPGSSRPPNSTTPTIPTRNVYKRE